MHPTRKWVTSGKPMQLPHQPRLQTERAGIELMPQWIGTTALHPGKQPAHAPRTTLL